MSSSKIPPLLAPYIYDTPPGSLTLVTSVLNATANWVLLRYLAAFLQPSSSQNPPASSERTSAGPTRVVFVSFLRDYAWWRTEAKRALGIDLDKAHAAGHLTFIDGLTSLFLPQSAKPTDPPAHPILLQSPDLRHLSSTISAALLPPTALIIDTPSILLSTTSPAITASALLSTILELREKAAGPAVLCVPADGPLLDPAAALDAEEHAARYPPLDVAGASFVVGAAHVARTIVGVRALDTGWARDVGGVVRVGRGGDWDGDGEGEGKGEGGEWLFAVGGDGGVRVWERP